MTKHIFNVQAIRDASTLKPIYSRITAFLRGEKDHGLKPADLEQIKFIINKESSNIIKRIDKELAK